MRAAAIRSWAVLFVLVFALVVSTRSTVSAETKEDARWSIDFAAISLSEAFDQLTQITGIKIFTTTPLAHTISPKHYLNQSIDQILKDMLKHMNYAAVWHYSERGIESIGIVAFDRERAESPSAVPSVKRAGTTSRSLPGRPGPRRLRPSGQVSGPEREVSVTEPPAELEETEGGETEERDEESEPSSMDDTSNPASSEAQVEPTEDASTGEEGRAGNHQNESEE